MSPVIRSLLCVLPVALAACGSGGGQMPAATKSTTTIDYLGYAPVYSDGDETVETQLRNDGISGFITNRDGSISEILIRLSEDGETAYVSIDGGQETEWSTKSTGSPHGGTWSNGGSVLSIGWAGSGQETSIIDDQTAVFGLETPGDALPKGEATYRGSWHTTSDTGRANGSMSMEFDFASGVVGGALKGGYAGNGRISGEISGSLDGSRLAGAIVLDPGDVTGTLTFMGAIYGADGDTAAGVLGGQLLSGGISDTQTGSFVLNQTGH